MQALARRLTNKLIEARIIKSKDQEIYYYGFWQGGLFLLNILTVLIIGMLFNMLWQSLVFTIAYGALRIMAGGYHASSQRSCYVLSLVLIVLVLMILKHSTWISSLYFPLLIFSSLIIFILAIILLIIVILYNFNKISIVHCLSVSIITEALMLLLGKYKIVY